MSASMRNAGAGSRAYEETVDWPTATLMPARPATRTTPGRPARASQPFAVRYASGTTSGSAYRVVAVS